jgi:hypothetical protein
VREYVEERPDAAPERDVKDQASQLRPTDPRVAARLAPLIGNRALARLIAGAPATRAPRRKLQRWDSPEHVQLGETAAGPSAPPIRLASHTRDLAGGYGGAGWPAGWTMLTPSPNADQVRAMTNGLSYGEVVALSGDFYRTWAELNAAPLREVIDLIPLIRAAATTTQLQNATAGRYLALASKNVSHFSNVPLGQRNVDFWRNMHTQAITAALAGNANEAWGLNACADHFLTDAFSGGHIRTPRAQLVTSSLGNIESKILHDLDNEHGVEVTNARGDRPWIAYGDDMINDPRNSTNRGLAEEAVRLSRQDITDALAHRLTSVPATFAAEALVPRPVNPAVDRWSGRTPTYVAGPDGEMIRVADDYTMTRDRVIRSEGPGVIAGFFTDDDQIRAWVGRMDSAAIARQPTDEKIRMIDTLMSGWISDDDMVAMEKILGSVSSPAEMQILRRTFEPRATEFTSIGQRTRFRVALARNP